MIKESKASTKLLAISTSEGSEETQQPPPTSSHCSPTTLETKKTVDPHDDVNNDESRDMGETGRVVHKPTMDRDDLESSFDSDKECTSTSDAVITESSQVKVEKVVAKETKMGTPLKGNKSSTGSTVKEPSSLVDDNTKKTSHHSLLPSLSTSFDHAMDGQPWSHSFNDRRMAVSKEKLPSKPRHRRSPAAMVHSLTCISLNVSSV